jgi:predicted metal-binding membrane protein
VSDVRVRRVDLRTVALGAMLFTLTIWSWYAVLRQSHDAMSGMIGMTPGIAEGATFVLQWGIMMVAMMLPSAAPMILLYQTVQRRLATDGSERAIPAWLFGATYVVLWTLSGIPVYGGYVAATALTMCCTWFSRVAPYAVAGALIAAGAYQLTSLKRACLAQCESPLSFLMTRWRSGYGATLALATKHALYCIGCCWALMLILVAAGMMGIWWVTGIAAVVFFEKVIPGAQRTATVVGAALIALGLVVVWRPELVAALR